MSRSEGSGPDRRARRSGIGSWTSSGRRRRALDRRRRRWPATSDFRLLLASARRSVWPDPRVWCWDDLWRLVRLEARTGRSWLSEAAAVRGLSRGGSAAREAGRLEAIEAASQWPGLSAPAPRTVPRLDRERTARRSPRGRRRLARGRPSGPCSSPTAVCLTSSTPRTTRGWRSGHRSGCPQPPVLGGLEERRRSGVPRLRPRRRRLLAQSSNKPCKPGGRST